MTDKEKLLKLKKLADAMYYAAQQLTTDASRLHKAMDEYHKFIIHECKEEPVSNDFEMALAEMIDKAQTSVVEPLVIAAQWKDELIKLAKSEEPVSEDWELAATKYAQDKYMPVQTSQAFKAGAQWQKEQLMASGTDVTVHIEAGNYPYIPQIELYDYDKDIPLAKEGDKYKVILIKEDWLWHDKTQRKL